MGACKKRASFGMLTLGEASAVCLRDVPASALRVYLVLLSMRNSRTLETPPITYAFIGEKSGVPKDTLRKSVKVLINAGLVVRVRGGRGYSSGSVYRLPLGGG